MIDRVGQVWARMWRRLPAVAPEVQLVELVPESSEIYGGTMHRTLNLETRERRLLPEGDHIPLGTADERVARGLMPLVGGMWIADRWVSRRPMPGDVLRARWDAGCSCLRRGATACGCGWRGFSFEACMVFLVLSSDEPGSGSSLSATCLALDYDRQEELSSTQAYCYRVGATFRAQDWMTPLHGAELVSEGSG